MSNDFSENKIELTDEYAEIFNSVYGDTLSQDTEPESGSTPVIDPSDYYRDDLALDNTNDDESGNLSNSQDELPDSYYPDPEYLQNNISISDESSSINVHEDNGYYDEEEDEEYSDDEDEISDSSFSDYLSSKIAGTLFRIKGTGSNSSSTMYEEEEDLGREVSVKYASKYYGTNIFSLNIRIKISVILMVLMVYFSLQLPLPGMLKSLSVLICCVMAMQFVMIVLCLDVFTTGILNMFSGNFGADSLASISCIITTIDAIYTHFSNNATPHMPLCVLSSLSLLGILYSSYLSTRGIRKALRVPAIGKRIYTVTGESDVIGHDITLLKSTRPITGFVRRIEEEPLDESTQKKAAPFIIIISLIFTIAYSVYSKNYTDTAYIFSKIFAPSVSFCSLLCFALPFYVGSKRIFTYGAAIAGWSGTHNLGLSKNLIVTDRDLFPSDCIEIENVRIFADYSSDKVISYAGSLVTASESSLTECFSSLMDENNCTLAPIDGFEILSGGGFKGLIDGHVVICGNTDLMRLLDVRVPFKLVSPTSLLLSIDGVLYGIFNIKYKADPDVRRALVSLMRSNRHPVFATRDFNVTPDMIKEVFDVATDGYDFPPYADRFPISRAKPAEDSLISAVVCREGLGPLTAMADTGRSIFVITRMNVVITMVSSFIAPVLFFLMLMTGKQISLAFQLIYMAVCALPVLILGITANTSS